MVFSSWVPLILYTPCDAGTENDFSKRQKNRSPRFSSRLYKKILHICTFPARFTWYIRRHQRDGDQSVQFTARRINKLFFNQFSISVRSIILWRVPLTCSFVLVRRFTYRKVYADIWHTRDAFRTRPNLEWFIRTTHYRQMREFKNTKCPKHIRIINVNDQVSKNNVTAKT